MGSSSAVQNPSLPLGKIGPSRGEFSRRTPCSPVSSYQSLNQVLSFGSGSPATVTMIRSLVQPHFRSTPPPPALIVFQNCYSLFLLPSYVAHVGLRLEAITLPITLCWAIQTFSFLKGPTSSKVCECRAQTSPVSAEWALRAWPGA